MVSSPNLLSPGSFFDNKSVSNILSTIELPQARYQRIAKLLSNIIKLLPNNYSALWRQLESKEKELAEYI